MLRRKILAIALLAAGAFASAPHSAAQSAVLTVPVASQQGTVSQRIGITDISIKYHRPMVGGRQIWGKVVPYGEVWRAGANENTTIEFADPVTVDGKPLAAGVYGLHMIPGESEWTVIFSKDHTSWGSFSYNEAHDALRVTVKPKPAEMEEALAYSFEEVKPESAVVMLRWEKLAVPFAVGVDVHEVMKESLHRQLKGIAQYTWEGWDDAATYLVDNKFDLDEALQYEDTSIGTEERFDNLLTKARILDAMDRKADAEAARNRAVELASAAQLYIYGRQLQQKGDQEKAFDYYRRAAKKDPNDWIARIGTARIYSSQGNYDGAVKEMQLSLAHAPENQKIFLQPMVKKLEAKQDINKN